MLSLLIEAYTGAVYPEVGMTDNQVKPHPTFGKAAGQKVDALCRNVTVLSL